MSGGARGVNLLTAKTERKKKNSYREIIGVEGLFRGKAGSQSQLSASFWGGKNTEVLIKRRTGTN